VPAPKNMIKTNWFCFQLRKNLITIVAWWKHRTYIYIAYYYPLVIWRCSSSWSQMM
jgi:hypothetical protein